MLFSYENQTKKFLINFSSVGLRRIEVSNFYACFVISFFNALNAGRKLIRTFFIFIREQH